MLQSPAMSTAAAQLGCQNSNLEITMEKPDNVSPAQWNFCLDHVNHGARNDQLEHKSNVIHAIAGLKAEKAAAKAEKKAKAEAAKTEPEAQKTANTASTKPPKTPRAPKAKAKAKTKAPADKDPAAAPATTPPAAA